MHVKAMSVQMCMFLSNQNITWCDEMRARYLSYSHGNRWSHCQIGSERMKCVRRARGKQTWCYEMGCQKMCCMKSLSCRIVCGWCDWVCRSVCAVVYTRVSMCVRARLCVSVCKKVANLHLSFLILVCSIDVYCFWRGAFPSFYWLFSYWFILPSNKEEWFFSVVIDQFFFIARETFIEFQFCWVLFYSFSRNSKTSIVVA